MRRSRSLLALCCLAITCGFIGCKKGDNAQGAAKPDGKAAAPADLPGWKIEKVTDTDFEETLELPSASVRGYETVQLLAKVGGYVKTLGKVDGETVDIGADVDEKTVLAVLDVPELDNELTEKEALVTQATSEVAQAKAAVSQADAELTRREREAEQAGFVEEEKAALVTLHQKAFDRIKMLNSLVDKKSRDEAEFALVAAKAAEKSAASAILTAAASVAAANADIEKANADESRAMAQVEVANAAVERAKTMIKYATIKSPFPGVITERLVDHGSFVRPATSNSGATPLFVVTRTGKVRVIVGVPNTRAFHVQRGQTVVFRKIGGLGSGELSSRVSRVATNLNPESRMLRIEADFENPVTDAKTGKTHTLVPGMFGTVRITLRSWTAKNGGRLPVVPESALFIGKDDRRYIVVVGTDGVAHRREVDVILFKDEIRVGPLEGKVGVREGVKAGERVVTERAAGIAEGTVISAEKSN